MIVYSVPLEFRQDRLAAMGDVYALTAHHTVTRSPLRKKDCVALIHEMHRWHLDRGWAGEGYHHVVDRLGRVYDVRPVRFKGAHTQDCNSGNVGVAFLGDFSATKLNFRQRRALRWLVEKYVRRDDISVLAGHREWPDQATACPGLILSYVRWLRGKYKLRLP